MHVEMDESGIRRGGGLRLMAGAFRTLQRPIWAVIDWGSRQPVQADSLPYGDACPGQVHVKPARARKRPRIP